ncbi:ABC transporter permease [Sphingosinicella soli]|uniref:Phospholipid/cholesterol/gamma-HCH transport system permease protein n=1 Tax=Sphingosinicella soli TaxID=333708 RepID=A0A7W7B118_9SPHN|nr:MlaE family lipid ABC transporter permease subunit [Sphingosinicella soli]MBB4632041.1 phospholipid/cholesterol/gamma-HCH transport system permease protein [Sphingosinicella soli]
MPDDQIPTAGHISESQTNDGGRTVHLSGRMTIRFIDPISRRLRELETDPAPLTIDLADIERIDTAGAWVLYRTRVARESAGLPFALTGASGKAEELIDQICSHTKPVKIRPDLTPGFIRTLEKLGGWIIFSATTFGGFLSFLGLTLVSLGKVIAARRAFRWRAFVNQFEAVGVSSLGIIGLMSFLVGIVVAQQGAVQLRQFGADVFVINLVGRITFRELGVLMTAIMVAGRSGSAFAAQIGSMKLAEEVDAMRTIGMPPIEVLVIPRLVAAVIAMPLLAFYGSMLGILGGMMLTWVSLGIPPATFIQRLQEVVPLTDVWVGLIKAPVFGLVIAVTGCFQGMQVRGNAEDVGLRTTAAVVQAIFLVIVIDAFFAVFFSAIGWN